MVAGLAATLLRTTKFWRQKMLRVLYSISSCQPLACHRSFWLLVSAILLSHCCYGCHCAVRWRTDKLESNPWIDVRDQLGLPQALCKGFVERHGDLREAAVHNEILMQLTITHTSKRTARFISAILNPVRFSTGRNCTGDPQSWLTSTRSCSRTTYSTSGSLHPK